MALNLQDKQAIVAEVSEVAKGALSAVVADSRGVTVDKMTELRKAGREAGVYMRVVRNTLLRRAVEGILFECLKMRSLVLMIAYDGTPGRCCSSVQRVRESECKI